MEPKIGGIIATFDSMIPGGIANLFNLALGFGAIMALGTIIYAGILYSIAGDNTSKQKEAKAWIWAAVKGLALLSFGVILINIINPGLQNIQDATIKDFSIIPNKEQGSLPSPIEVSPNQIETLPPSTDYLLHQQTAPGQRD